MRRGRKIRKRKKYGTKIWRKRKKKRKRKRKREGERERGVDQQIDRQRGR